MGFHVTPSLSIITVTRNDVDGLQITAESLLRQVDKEFEWIVVEGYSDDNSMEFLTSNRFDFETKVMQSEPKGIYNAMNKGLFSSTSDYVWFINSGDTLIDINAVSIIKNEINRTGREAIALPVLHITSSGIFVDISFPNVISTDNFTIANINHQGAVVTRKLLLEIGGFDEDLKYASDGKLLDQVAKYSGFYLSNYFLVSFRMGGASAKHINTTIKEIHTYRPPIEKSIFVIILKTKIRLFMLKVENLKVIGCVVKHYFKHKQSRLEKFSHANCAT